MSHIEETRNRNDIIINNIFVFQLIMEIMINNEDQEQKTVDEHRKRND